MTPDERRRAQAREYQRRLTARLRAERAQEQAEREERARRAQPKPVDAREIAKQLRRLGCTRAQVERHVSAIDAIARLRASPTKHSLEAKL